MSDNSLKIKIEGDDNHYEKTLKEIEGKTKKSVAEISKEEEKLMQSRKEAVESADKLAKKMVVTAGLVGGAVLGTGIAYNSQIEQYQAGLKTMLGSAEKADETLGNLKEFASTTPFELTDLANASTTLLAFGENVDDLMPDLKMLGDISLGNKEKFSSLALVFGQVKSQGRLMGQDLLQMINAGFNPLMVISEKTGESMDSLKDKMSKGQITFEMVADAMKTATRQGGQFYNAMEEQSKTLQGQFSTLTDSVQEFTGEVSEDLSEYLTNDVLPALIDKMETLKEMWEDGSLRKYLGGAAAAATSLGVAIAAIKIGGLIGDIKQLHDGVKNFTAATKLGTAAQKAFNAAQNLNVWIKLAAAIVAVVAAVWSYISVAGIAESGTKKLADELKNTREEYENAIKSIDKTTAEQIAETKVVDTLKDKLYKLEEQLNSNTLSENLAKEKRKEFNTVANELNEIIPGIVENIKDENGQLVVQKKEINSLITSYKELAIAKAYATAYESKMNEAAKNVIEAEEQIIKAEKNYKKAWDTGYESAKKNKSVSENATPEEMEQFAKNYADEFAYDDYVNLTTAQKNLKTYTKDMEKYADLYTDKINKIGEQTEETGGKIGGVAGEVTETVKTETGKQKTILSQAQKAVLDIVEQAHKLGIISDKDYYDALSIIRDEYFEAGSDDWQKYTDDIANYYTDTLKKLKDKMEQFSQKLHDDAHKTYSTITLYEGENPKTWTTLADMDAQNAKLEEYYNLLNLVKEKRGDIPKDALSELSQMETDEAIKFLKTMLNASDKQWDDWVTGIEKNKELAEKLSYELHENELDENQELINGLKEQWGELPDEFFKVGQDCAEQYGAGLKNTLAGIFAEGRASVMNMFSSAPVASVISGVSGIGSGSSTTYTDNRTTNIYAPSTSARGIVEAEKQSQIYQAHTSTFGG